jgi:hypothetical protein
VQSGVRLEVTAVEINPSQRTPCGWIGSNGWMGSNGWIGSNGLQPTDG